MKIAVKIILGLVGVAALGFAYWTWDHQDREHRATPGALAALESDANVTVTQAEWITFAPANATPTKGLIFYPGGECDERGYAQPLREIAAAGYLVVLVPMPFQLAVFAPDSATEVLAAHPDIESWAIAGHSLGGSMAARYAFHHPGNMQGMIMWDAYPADDMSGETIKTRMIHRADQAGNPPDFYEPHLSSLPEGTDFYPVKGGNHLNFGSFIAGRMYRDEPVPDLDPQQQLELVAGASIDFMKSL